MKKSAYEEGRFYIKNVSSVLEFTYLLCTVIRRKYQGPTYTTNICHLSCVSIIIVSSLIKNINKIIFCIFQW